MAQDNAPIKLSVQWQDMPNDGSLDYFARSNHLSSRCIRLAESEVIILPNNTVLSVPSSDKHIFAPATKEVLSVLQTDGIQVQIYDDGEEKRELILKSADVILPILLFIEKVALPLGLGILGKWIYDRWIKAKTKSPTSIRVEYAQVEKDGAIVRWRRVEGPVNDVYRLLSEETSALAEEIRKT